MKSSVSLGRILGFPVEVHFTLLLFLGLVLLMGGGLGGVALMVLVFASVLAHELGHSVVARGLGVPILGITLYPFGGVAKMARLPDDPREEVVIAAAGPVVSLALGGAFWALGGILGSGLFVQLAGINAILGLFNLLPALPMDGGRIFRGLLQTRVGALRATRIAVRVARVLAVVMGIVGLFTSPMLVLIALLVWWMAGQEERAARARMRGTMSIDPDVLRLWREAVLRQAQADEMRRRRPRASRMVIDVG